MTKDYCEILLEVIDTVASTKIPTSAEQVSINQDEQTQIIEANPFTKILQDRVADLSSEDDTKDSFPLTLAPNTISNFNLSWLFTEAPKYDILGLECLITSSTQEKWNSEYSNSYGIQLIIDTVEKTYTTEFDSSEMLGDVFNFISFKQKKSFDLTDLTGIRSISLKFYNNTEKTSVQFAQVKLRIGYNLNTFGKASEPLVLYAEDGELEYTATGISKRLLVRYLYQEGESWRAVNHNNANDRPMGTTIRWYRYTPNSPQGDEWGGAYWAYINGQDNKFEYMATNFDSAKENEQFKVVALIGNDTGSVITTLTSKPVILQNRIEGLHEQLTNRSILFMDNTNGVYPYYYPTEEVNKEKSIIPDQLYQAYINRILKLNYTTDLTDQELWESLRSVEWQIPKSLAPAGEQGAAAADNGTYYSWKQEIFTSSGIEDYKQALSTVFTFEYRILTSLGFNLSNTIKCIVSLSDGQDYEFTADIAPTIAGSGGTDNSVIVELKDASGAPRCAIVPGETLYLYPKVFDNEMNLITELTVNCEKYLPDNNTTNYWSILNEGNRWQINANDDIPLGTLMAVKFTFTLDKKFSSVDGSALKIEEIVPIGLTTRVATAYIGPTSVVYDTTGSNPSYNRTPPSIIENGVTKKNVTFYPINKISDSFPAINGGLFSPNKVFDKKVEEKLYGLNAAFIDNNAKDNEEAEMLDTSPLLALSEELVISPGMEYISVPVYYRNQKIKTTFLYLFIETYNNYFTFDHIETNPESGMEITTEIKYNGDNSEGIPTIVRNFQWKYKSTAMVGSVAENLPELIGTVYYKINFNKIFEKQETFTTMRLSVVSNNASGLACKYQIDGITEGWFVPQTQSASIYFGSSYTQPIIIRQNRYFSSIINEWDGSLQVDQEGNRIMAAAYVAGSKNEENQFTGLVMGEMGKLSLTEAKANVETGLFGYSEGAQTFGFRTNGTGFIGRSGEGQILFDGNSGVIQSGNFDATKWGDKVTTLGAAYDFQIGENKYKIKDTFGTGSEAPQGSLLDLQNGNLFVNNGYFKGKIKATSGEIANWTITNTALYTGIFNGDGSTPNLYLGAPFQSGNLLENPRTNIVFQAGANFGVDDNGLLYAGGGIIGGWSLYNNFLINGIYTANSGPDKVTCGLYGAYIGNENIDQPRVTKESLVTSGQYSLVRFFAGAPRTSITDNPKREPSINEAAFMVLTDGSLYATNAVVEGTLKAGNNSQIGSWFVGTPFTGYSGALYTSSKDNEYIMFLRDGGSESNINIGVKRKVDGNWEDVFYIKKNGSALISGFLMENDSIMSQPQYDQEGNPIYSNRVGMNCHPDSGYWAFWAGSQTGTNAPFRVGHGGELYATKGAIGGWIIENSELRTRSSTKTPEKGDVRLTATGVYVMKSKGGKWSYDTWDHIIAGEIIAI